MHCTTGAAPPHTACSIPVPSQHDAAWHQKRNPVRMTAQSVHEYRCPVNCEHEKHSLYALQGCKDTKQQHSMDFATTLHTPHAQHTTMAQHSRNNPCSAAAFTCLPSSHTDSSAFAPSLLQKCWQLVIITKRIDGVCDPLQQLAIPADPKLQ